MGGGNLPPALPPRARHREIPHEREGGLPDVPHHVLHEGPPRRQAALQGLPDPPRQRRQWPQGRVKPRSRGETKKLNLCKLTIYQTLVHQSDQ